MPPRGNTGGFLHHGCRERTLGSARGLHYHRLLLVRVVAPDDFRTIGRGMGAIRARRRSVAEAIGLQARREKVGITLTAREIEAMRLLPIRTQRADWHPYAVRRRNTSARHICRSSRVPCGDGFCAGTTISPYLQRAHIATRRRTPSGSATAAASEMQDWIALDDCRHRSIVGRCHASRADDGLRRSIHRVINRICG